MGDFDPLHHAQRFWKLSVIFLNGHISFKLVKNEKLNHLQIYKWNSFQTHHVHHPTVELVSLSVYATFLHVSSSLQKIYVTMADENVYRILENTFCQETFSTNPKYNLQTLNYRLNIDIYHPIIQKSSFLLKEANVTDQMNHKYSCRPKVKMSAPFCSRFMHMFVVDLINWL